MKIALGAMMHESNTFARGRTTLENFHQTQYLTGQDIIEAHEGGRSEIGGMLQTLKAEGAGVLPTLSAWAMPSPLVAKAAYLEIKSQMIEQLRSCGEPDGILLALHGAMTVEEIEDPEGDLLASIRQELPSVEYLVASLDHHGNVTQQMFSHSDVLVGYRTHPHVDQFEVGCAAAEHLVELIKEKPAIRKSFIKLPLMTPAENRSEPIEALRSEVERLDGDPNVMTSSFFVGYPWADVSIQGASVLAVTYDDQALADRCAAQLAEKMWQLRDGFLFPIYSVEEAVRVGRASHDQPFVFDELCDCTLGGASGDVVSTARYFYQEGIGDSVAVGIVDRQAVSAAVQAGMGSAVKLSIGGKVCTKDNPPLAFEGHVKSVNADVAGDTSIHAGYETPLGKIAVVEGRGFEIILIERAGKLGGPSFLEELGINPKQRKFIIVKEGLNPLETYKGVAAQILMVDSPGFDRQILRPQDYAKVPRPMYPLDPKMGWGSDGGG